MMRQSCLRTARRLANVKVSSQPTSALRVELSTSFHWSKNDNFTSKRFFSKPRVEHDDFFMDDEPEDDFFMDDDGDNLKTGLTAPDMEFFEFEDDEYFTRGKEKEDQDEVKAQEMEKNELIQKELDLRKGRLWEDPYEITDEDWSSGLTQDDLPDWSPDLCSRISKERVQVHPKGVPTLEEIAKLTLPPPPPPHPAHGNFKPYLKQRNKNINDKIYKAASYLLEPHMERILNMDNDNWDEKQNAIDELYEKVLEGIKSVPPKAFGVYAEEDDQMSVVLARLPDFAKRVEVAIEKYLKNVLQKEKVTCAGNEIKKIDPKPIFMDLLKAQNNNAVGEDGVPKLVYPLKNHKNHGPGRMVEEWQLAADIDTRRIMIREATRDVAAAMTEAESSRVYVKGPKGAGKTAVLASIVASARESGHIVLYLPDGNRLSRNGYYTEINEHRSQGRDTKIFDLPKISQEICVELLASHEKDLKDLDASPELLANVFTTEQLRTFLGLGKEETFDLSGQPLINLLQFGTENLTLASGCYSAAVETLMNQTEKTFTVVMDEFNCYYEAGHYFSADYDIHVNHPIPMNQISLVQPFLDAFGAERKDDGTIVTKSSKPMKKGHIIVGVTESRAIGRQKTADLTNAVVSAGCSTVHVPQYSPLEVKHILSNFEVIGIGRLRFDRGATVMNDQEVNYLRSVSGGYGQPLLDACLH